MRKVSPRGGQVSPRTTLLACGCARTGARMYSALEGSWCPRVPPPWAVGGLCVRSLEHTCYSQPRAHAVLGASETSMRARSLLSPEDSHTHRCLNPQGPARAPWTERPIGLEPLTHCGWRGVNLGQQEPRRGPGDRVGPGLVVKTGWSAGPLCWEQRGRGKQDPGVVDQDTRVWASLSPPRCHLSPSSIDVLGSAPPAGQRRYRNWNPPLLGNLPEDFLRILPQQLDSVQVPVGAHRCAASLPASLSRLGHCVRFKLRPSYFCCPGFVGKECCSESSLPVWPGGFLLHQGR